MQSLEDAAELGYFIPQMPTPGAHHVISRGDNPKFYRLTDLLDRGEGKTAWVDAFEKIIVGLYWTLEHPVPYAFKTPDGKIRSLDAGCIKMLLNREQPDLAVIVDAAGFIDAVVPSTRLLELYQPIHKTLTEKIRSATKD